MGGEGQNSHNLTVDRPQRKLCQPRYNRTTHSTVDGVVRGDEQKGKQNA